MPKLEITRLTVGDLDTQCYLVADPDTRRCVIIDPADEGGFLTEQILALQLQPLAIVLTHGHFDHLLASLELKLNFDIPIVMHEADAFLLQRAQTSAEHWLKHHVDPVPPADTYVSDGHTLPVGNAELRILHTPGHTPGSICLVGDQIIFTGDTLFKDSIGRTNLKYSKPLVLYDSLRKILDYPPNFLLLPGHGDTTTVAEAQAYLLASNN